jgi:hypothetical protein
MRIAIRLLLAGLTGLPAAGQTRPDLSGTWVVVDEQSGIEGATHDAQGDSAFGPRITIAVTPSALVVEVTGSPGRKALSPCPLDGREHRESVPGHGSEPPADIVTRGAWCEDGLLVTIRRSTAQEDGQVRSITIEKRLSLDASGRLLVRTSPGGQEAARVSVYRRQPRAAGTRTPGPMAKIAQLEWLAGPWRMQRGETAVEEWWSPPAGGAMLAISRTVRGDRLLEFEYLRIVEREGSLVYIAQPNGRPPTEFALTAIGPDSARFENPAHDFPRVIEYVRQDEGVLEATVSDGAARQLRFLFARPRN